MATSSAEVASSRIRIARARSSARTMPHACRSLSESSSTGMSRSSRAEQLVEHRLARACASRAPGRALRADAVAPQPDVVEHGAGLGDEHLLEHGDDAALLRGARRRGARPARREARSAASGRVHAAEDLDERALAGAVLADERVHLAGAQLERRSAQSLGGAEGLRSGPRPEPATVRRFGARRRRGAVRRRHSRAGSFSLYLDDFTPGGGRHPV